MSRFSLIHQIFNSVPSKNRALSRAGDRLVQVGSPVNRSGVHTYATLEKLSEHDLVDVAHALGLPVDADKVC
jgi:hypothetical protein